MNDLLKIKKYTLVVVGIFLLGAASLLIHSFIQKKFGNYVPPNAPAAPIPVEHYLSPNAPAAPIP